jgi:hypothetical protein
MSAPCTHALTRHAFALTHSNGTAHKDCALSHIDPVCHGGNACMSHIDASKVTAPVTRAVLEQLDISC